jgi:hypothetical protein
MDQGKETKTLIMRLTLVGQSCFDRVIECEVTLRLEDELLQLSAARRTSSKDGTISRSM